MYCSQCGKEISETSKFCSNCGCPVHEEEKSNFAPKHQSSFDAVEDIQKKLREIDNRKKPPVKKGDVIKSALDVVKGEASALTNLKFLLSLYEVFRYFIGISPIFYV